MHTAVRRRHDQSGFSTSTGLVATAVSLLVVAVLLLVGMDAFGGGGSGTSTGNTSILSRSPAESQVKLCAEGRDSTYGSPPTPAQQAKCLNQLAGEISSTGGAP